MKPAGVMRVPMVLMLQNIAHVPGRPSGARLCTLVPPSVVLGHVSLRPPHASTLPSSPRCCRRQTGEQHSESQPRRRRVRAVLVGGLEV